MLVMCILFKKITQRLNSSSVTQICNATPHAIPHDTPTFQSFKPISMADFNWIQVQVNMGNNIYPVQAIMFSLVTTVTYTMYRGVDSTDKYYY